MCDCFPNDFHISWIPNLFHFLFGAFDEKPLSCCCHHFNLIYLGVCSLPRFFHPIFHHRIVSYVVHREGGREFVAKMGYILEK